MSYAAGFFRIDTITPRVFSLAHGRRAAGFWNEVTNGERSGKRVLLSSLSLEDSGLKTERKRKRESGKLERE
jgi:hypothetical protein